MPKLSKVFFWQLGFGALALLCIALLVKLWMSGVPETQVALDDGRRLLIRLDTGEIQGNQINSETPESPTSEAASPTEEQPSPSTETAPATPPEKQAAPAETSAPTLSENAESKTDPAAVFTPPVETQPFPSTIVTPSVVTSTEKALAPVNEALTEKGPHGVLPVIGADGTKPWRYYSQPYERKNTQPMIAIIITGLGQNKNATDNAIRLPPEIALSFSPYARDVDTWVNAARLSGHEVLLDLPLEPTNYPASDPGPYGLLLGREPSVNDERLKWLMARFPAYIGFLTPQNEAFSTSIDDFKALMQVLSMRGLMLVMGHEPVKSEIKDMVESGNTAAIIADMLIDEELSPTAIQTRLTSLTQVAKNRGYAIGIAQGYPITLQQLNAWAAKLAEEGFVLVPVSFIVKQRFS